jgi:hypothetical protein
VANVTRSRLYSYTSLAFTAAGCLWCVAALVTGNVGVHVPIGMMFICIGMMFLTLGQQAARQDQQPKDQTGPTP